MLGIDLIKMSKAGQHPVMEFTKEVDSSYCEEPDPGMRFRFLSYFETDVKNEIGIRGDIKEFEAYNLVFEKPDFRDENNRPTLKWHETKIYPKDGIYEFYARIDQDIDFIKIVNASPVYQKYLDSKNKLSYIQWLEKQVEKNH